MINQCFCGFGVKKTYYRLENQNKILVTIFTEAGIQCTTRRNYTLRQCMLITRWNFSLDFLFNEMFMFATFIPVEILLKTVYDEKKETI